MKFSHIADVHIGGYREEKLKKLSTEAFVKSMEMSVEENVDFILISGDLFNTSLPTIDNLKIVTAILKDLKDRQIPVYIIPGSHDFSPSGKTMLDVLENAGLCTNVVKGQIVDGKLQLQFTIDPKTGVKITGMLGKKGTLEKQYYESLDTSNLVNEPGFKIFMFHSAITELKRQDMEKMESTPISLLPKNFQYYAGGHVHYPLMKFDENLNGLIAYTGALFPNNFKELEDLNYGGFWIYDSEKTQPEFKEIKFFETMKIKLNCDKKTPEEINAILEEVIEQNNFNNKLVLIRLFGTLKIGKVSDIDLKTFFEKAYEKNAYFVMKNASKVQSEEFQEVRVQIDSIKEIEEKLIQENTGQIKFNKLPWDKDAEENVVKFLLHNLNLEKQEGETVADFEERLRNNMIDLFKL